MVNKIFLILGSLNMALAVMLGAFAAHGLKQKLPENFLSAFSTGVEYHFYHAIGLLVVGLVLLQIEPNSWIKISGWTMLLGILLFCGSLYLMSLLQIRWLGIVTPFGGLAFIVSWLFLLVGIIKSNSI